MRYLGLTVAVFALVAAAVAGCRGKPTASTASAAPATASQEDGRMPMQRFTITSTAFAEGKRIPQRYTGDGANVSPPLAWQGAPAAAVSLALIVDDPDAPRGTFTHWLLYGLPVSIAKLPEAVPADRALPGIGGAKQGTNDMGKVGYAGPAPPPGPVHHYQFTLYALDAPLDVPPGAKRAALDSAMQGHTVGQTRLVGVYSR